MSFWMLSKALHYMVASTGNTSPVVCSECVAVVWSSELVLPIGSNVSAQHFLNQP
jgi:hypothetical protein